MCLRIKNNKFEWRCDLIGPPALERSLKVFSACAALLAECLVLCVSKNSDASVKSLKLKRFIMCAVDNADSVKKVEIAPVGAG